MTRTRTNPEAEEAAPVEPEPEKRRRILHAAVRVFAEKGYHGCRIADVARAAGVAYGLVYHYFQNKDELLESVFDEQWTIFINALQAIDAGPGTAADKIAGLFGFVFDVYKTAPAAVRVLMLEVTHTPEGLRAGSTRETFERAVRLLAALLRKGQERGELRRQPDPIVAATALLGALELTLSGMVIGLVPAATEEDVDRAKVALSAAAIDGLRAQPR
ncbi:MAG TPA: TetR/AcrR family transcriptional regulator [Anaeromyxobacter sp.]|nr:TetR/AcrR family transcriptional regulator [Anaeromyxobacter sp.]